MKENNTKKVVISIVAIVVLIAVVIGVTYAAFTFSKAGTTQNSITTGTITMTYTEGDNGITINNAMPTTDELGKTISNSSQLFDFTVNVNVVGNTTVSYEVTAVKQNSSTLKNDEVRLYLEKGENSATYSEAMAPSYYTPLGTTDDFGASTGEMVMDTGSTNQTVTYYYRLRMWVNKEYKLNDTAKSFTVKVKVYGKGGVTTEITPVNKVCKRATTLHNDGTHTYGSLGVAGTLSSGDAFDCDVNKDNTYDSATERFYYVTDMNSNTAVMIYYNNTASGVASNSTTFAYDSVGTPYTNGPVTALAQLPTTAQWTNVSLTNITRNLLDEKGTLRKSGFSYAGYAARLLTTQEVGATCGITVGSYTTGEFDSCTYLMENTKYQSSSLKDGYWLENSASANSYDAWYVFAGNRHANNTSSSRDTYFGVRPAIEILKSDISY